MTSRLWQCLPAHVVQATLPTSPVWQPFSDGTPPSQHSWKVPVVSGSQLISECPVNACLQPGAQSGGWCLTASSPDNGMAPEGGRCKCCSQSYYMEIMDEGSTGLSDESSAMVPEAAGTGQA